jgi:YVTN family beta-propeller protein
MQNLVKSTWKDAVFPYLVYVLFFLGMGLTSGSIVHMPIDPHKYTIILFVGMAVFVVASLLNETVIDKKNLSVVSTIRLVVFSLLLSVGIGMISGGIQHFEDVVKYAAYLIPGGILLSFISYLFRYNINLGFKKATPLFAILLITIISLSFTLKLVAAKMPEGEGHSHGDEAAFTNSIIVEGNAVNTANTTTKSSSYYFTANEEGSITKLDSVTNRILVTMKVDGIIHNVQMSPDNKILAATMIPKTLDHVDSHGHGLVLFYNAENNELINKVSVGSHAAHVDFTKDGKYVLVSNTDQNNVSIIDAKTYKLIKKVETGKGPHGFRISSDSKYAYVANYESDTISVIDINALKEIKQIKVGKNPVTTAVTADGKFLLATISSENSLALVDLNTEAIKKITVGNGPAQVYIQKDGKYAFVANQGTEKNPSNTLSKIDLTSKSIVATIETGKGAHGIVVSDDNQYVYVTNMYDNTVSVIDNSKNKVIAIIPVGKTPNGITYKN